MRIALKVDVDTYRGTLEGVPALIKLFDKYQVKATFLFSVGPDHTGRAIRRLLRPGFLAKVRRTSVATHYGLKTLLYGVLLPGPHIGRKAGHIMRVVKAQGHEVGVHCYDHIRWQDFVANKDAAWTAREMHRGWAAFTAALESPPATCGAAGWQLNRHVPALEESLGLYYASDVRGAAPFYPQMEGVVSRCVQIPTTLPTLDELIGADNIDANNVDQRIFERSRRPAPHGHVYTLHAELEGMHFLSAMERLLQQWLAAGDRLGTLANTYQSLDLATLPHKRIEWGSIAGRSGRLAIEDAAASGC